MIRKLRGLKRFWWVLGSRPAREDAQGLPGLCAGSHGTTGAPWVALPSAGNRAGLPGLRGCRQESLWASWVALPSAGTHRACQATVRGFSRVPTRRCPNAENSFNECRQMIRRTTHDVRSRGHLRSGDVRRICLVGLRTEGGLWAGPEQQHKILV